MNSVAFPICLRKQKKMVTISIKISKTKLRNWYFFKYDRYHVNRTLQPKGLAIFGLILVCIKRSGASATKYQDGFFPRQNHPIGACITSSWHDSTLWLDLCSALNRETLIWFATWMAPAYCQFGSCTYKPEVVTLYYRKVSWLSKWLICNEENIVWSFLYPMDGYKSILFINQKIYIKSKVWYWMLYKYISLPWSPINQCINKSRVMCTCNKGKITRNAWFMFSQL